MGLVLSACVDGCFSTQIAFRRLSSPQGNIGMQNQRMKESGHWAAWWIGLWDVSVSFSEGGCAWSRGGPLTFIKQYEFVKPQRCCQDVKNDVSRKRTSENSRFLVSGYNVSLRLKDWFTHNLRFVFTLFQTHMTSIHVWNTNEDILN